MRRLFGWLPDPYYCLGHYLAHWPSNGCLLCRVSIYQACESLWVDYLFLAIAGFFAAYILY